MSKRTGKQRRRNPAYQLPPEDLGRFFGGVLRGLFPDAKLINSGTLVRPEGLKAPECAACDGTCLCHHVGALGGVDCPMDCPNYGNHLDGCHRCDCKPDAKTQATGNDQTSGRGSEGDESPNK
jgi:hypothetical protein